MKNKKSDNIGVIFLKILVYLIFICLLALMIMPKLKDNSSIQEQNKKPALDKIFEEFKNDISKKDVKTQVKEALSEVNQALEKEYRLYGKRMLKSSGRKETIKMLTNHLDIVKIAPCPDEKEYTCLTTTEGIDYQIWPSGLGFDLRVVSDEPMRNLPYACESIEDCEDKAIGANVFTITACPESVSYYAVCPVDPISYSYFHDMTIREVINKYGAGDRYDFSVNVNYNN